MLTFDKIRKAVKPTDRVILSPKEIKTIRSAPSQRIGMKPKGLWYGIGTSWVDWLEGEGYSISSKDWGGKYIYKLKLSGGVLRIKSAAELDEFTDEYNADKHGIGEFGSFINWHEVAKKYKGIEIAPYQSSRRHRYMWYYGWDVASGCIWSASAVSKFIRVTVEN